MAVGLGGRSQVDRRSERSQIGLLHATDREHGAGELRLVEHVHHVALILGRIRTALERVVTIGAAADVGMVAGGDGVEAEQVGPLREARELDRPVAFDARVGRDSTGVCVDVGGHDVFVEVVTEIEHEVVDAELLCHAARIVDIGHRTAAGVTVATPQLHRDPDDVVARLLEQQRCNRGIDPTRHRAHHLHDALAMGSGAVGAVVAVGWWWRRS